MAISMDLKRQQTTLANKNCAAWVRAQRGPHGAAQQGDLSLMSERTYSYDDWPRWNRANVDRRRGALREFTQELPLEVGNALCDLMPLTHVGVERTNCSRLNSDRAYAADKQTYIAACARVAIAPIKSQQGPEDVVRTTSSFELDGYDCAKFERAWEASRRL
jgi:hypothetical protein